MNNVMAFVKQRWLILTLALVVLLAVPAMLWYSNKMQNDLREKMQKEIQADLNAIVSGKDTIKIPYTVPAIASRSEQSFRFAPNEKVIAEFGARRKAQSDDLGRVVAAAMKFNQGKRAPLIEGLFPAPASSIDETIKPREFQRLYLDPEGAHKELLKSYRAGPPLDPLILAAELKDKQNDLVRNFSAGDKTDFNQLSADDQAKVNKQVLDFRLRRYLDSAATRSFYCEVAAFKLPQTSNDAPSVAQCWWWQWEYWMREDVLRAAYLANKPAADQGVPGSVVKRISEIVIEAPNIGPADPSAPPAAAFPLGSEAVTPLTPAVSLTGRVGGGPGSTNNYYDLRRFSIDFIASADRLPLFIEALAATNFMTVLDCDLTRVDTADDLKNGYFYGDEAVVRGRVVVESIWLREWMMPLTPREARLGLGIPDPPVEGADPNAAPAAPPPTAPAAPGGHPGGPPGNHPGGPPKPPGK